MDRKEAARLVRKCIPAMKQQAGENDVEEDGNLDESQIQVKSLCRLWAGMGYVYDVSFGSSNNSPLRRHVIIKRVSPRPKSQRQSLGDRRKADSYQCEAKFYENLAQDLIEKSGLDIPRPYYVEHGKNEEVIICMSQLDGQSGYLGETDTRAVLRWLATLHAATWGDLADEAVEVHGLQPIGTYWHLDTRPEEHMGMSKTGWQGRLKRAARAIDDRLKRDKMQCCVHGDAKDANMLFHQTSDTQEVSMYDFQYCGKGPPTKDLAYFLCVAAHDNDPQYVEYYHQELTRRLIKLPGRKEDQHIPSLSELHDSLQLAYCDWSRFMCGWGFWGTDLTGEVMAVLDRLDGGTDLGSEGAYDEAVRREYG